MARLPEPPGAIGVHAQRLAELEQALRESEARLSIITENAPGLIYQFLLRPDGSCCFPYASTWSQSMFGIAPETLLADGWPLINLILPEDRPGFDASVTLSRNTMEPWRWEGRLRAANGEIVWHQGISKPERQPDGSILWSGLFFDVTDRKRAEAARAESLARFAGFATASQYGMGMADLDGHILYANPKLTEMLGEASAEDCLGAHFPTVYYPPDMMRKLQEEVLPALMRDGHWHGELMLRTRRGRLIPTDENYFVIPDEQGRPRYLADILTDITERKRAEAHIKASLREKEVLLQEIYHRVKNNLQVVASLLAVQARSATDRPPQELLRESADRVKSIALVHEQLYRSGDLSRIDFRTYVRELTDQLRQAYESPSRRFALHLDIAPISLGVDVAIPLGLITNELMSNAYKHACADTSEGEIRVSLAPGGDGRLRLSVADNGPGFPADFAIERTSSLGMRLIRSLVNQIEGELSIENDSGAVFSIVFSLSSADEAAESSESLEADGGSA